MKNLPSMDDLCKKAEAIESIMIQAKANGSLSLDTVLPLVRETKNIISQMQSMALTEEHKRQSKVLGEGIDLLEKILHDLALNRAAGNC